MRHSGARDCRRAMLSKRLRVATATAVISLPDDDTARNNARLLLKCRRGIRARGVYIGEGENESGLRGVFHYVLGRESGKMRFLFKWSGG